MKKIISLLLLMCIVVASFSVFAISGYADEDAEYERLYQQKQEYVDKVYGKTFFDWGYFYYPLIEFSLDVLLYTRIGEEITLVKEYDGTSEYLCHDLLLITSYKDDSEYPLFYFTSPELSKAAEAASTPPYHMRESRCVLRECIQYFGLTKTEILEANERLKNDPDSIRNLLPMLTDEEFERIKPVGLPEEEFMVEALFIEDDRKAHDLLTKPCAVYVPEFGRVTEFYELLYCDYYDPDDYISVEEFIETDLTTPVMREFVAFLCGDRYIHWHGGFNYTSDINTIVSAQKAQFEAKGEEYIPPTGESLIYIPIAAVSIIAAVMVVRTRRKRIEM